MNHVHCPMQTSEEAAAILLDYADRRLDAATAAQLDRHVAQCDDCRRMVASQRAVAEALDEWRPADIAADFDARLAQRIAAEQNARPWWKSLNPFAPSAAWWKPAMPLAAACMLLVAIGLWKTGPSAQEFEKKAAVYLNQDPQQLEDTLSDLEMLRQLGVAEEGASASSRQAL